MNINKTMYLNVMRLNWMN